MIRTDFGEFPYLATARTILRPLHQDDADEIYRLRTDEEVNRWLGRKKAETKQDALEFINLIIRLVDGREAMYWAIQMKDDSRFAGTFSLFSLDQSAAKAEIGYELLPEFQGKGLMQEVMDAILRFGFSEMKLKRIEACLAPQNIRSINLLNKCGFTYEGPSVEPGEDLVVYAISI